MNIDIYGPPAPLRFGEGAAAFGLKLKRFSDTERMAIVDAIAAASFEAIQRAVDAIVIGWEDVRDAAGHELPFTREEDGRTVANLPRFLGAIPLELQATVLAGIVAFVGVPGEQAEGLARALKASGAGSAETGPTTPPASGTPAGASGG